MKKEKMILKKLSISICLLIAGNVVAQSDTSGIKQLNAVVISATRSEKNPMDIGRSVTVISGDEIRSSVFNSLAEVLAMHEGISIVGTNQNPGSTQNIFMRGTNSNHTIIMIDGVPLTDPSSTNSALNLSELSTSNIDRIEIVRGSHSTIYGSAAIGGVINIITRKNQKDGFHCNAELSGGTFGKQTIMAFDPFFNRYMPTKIGTPSLQSKENVFMNYTSKIGVYGNVEILKENIRGLDATIDTVINPLVYKNRDRDNSFRNEAQTKLGFKNKKIDAFVSFKLVNTKSDIDKTAFVDDDNYTLDFKRGFVNYQASYNLNETISFKFNGGYSSMKRYACDDSSIVDTAGNFDHTFYDDNYLGTTLNNEISTNYHISGLDIVAGIGLSSETMTSRNYYYSNGPWGPYESKINLDTLNIKSQTDYAFLHTDLNGKLFAPCLAPFSIALGIRQSHHSLFGNNITYEINPTVKLTEDALLFASYSTGFNAPSLYELYSPSVDMFSNITRGNKNLKPETSRSVEFGVKQKVGNKTFMSVSYFNSVVTNAIEYVYLWNKNTSLDSLSFFDYKGDAYLNIGSLSTHGIELSFESKLNNRFSFNANISLVNGKLNYNPSLIDTSKTKGNHVQLYSTGDFINKEVESIQLVRRPSTAVLGINYTPCKRISFLLDVKYTGAKNDVYYNSELGPFGALGFVGVKDYTLLDITAKAMITKSFSAIFKIENMLDEKYTEIYGFTTKGRGFYLSLRFAI